MPSEIHALMQYAHDIDARRSHSIEDHVRFDGMSVIATFRRKIGVLGKDIGELLQK